MEKLIIKLFLACCLNFSISHGSLQLTSFENEHVDTINDLLPVKFDINSNDSHWKTYVERYLFYSVALTSMRAQSVNYEDFAHSYLNGNYSEHFLNMNVFTLMAQQASQTLRASANEAEYYITRDGKLRTASSSLIIASSIMGLLGIILAPFGGFAISGAAVGLGVGSVITALPTIVIEPMRAKDAVFKSPDYYAKIANNQIRMVQQQGQFLTNFLIGAHEVLIENVTDFTGSDLEQIENFIFYYNIDQILFEKPLESITGERIVLSKKAFIEAHGTAKATSTIEPIRQAYNDLIKVMDVNDWSKEEAIKYIDDTFENNYEKLLEVLKAGKTTPMKLEAYLETNWHEVMLGLSSNSTNHTKLAKDKLAQKALSAPKKLAKELKTLMSFQLDPKANRGKLSKALLKSALTEITDVLETIVIGYSIYDVFLGIKNLQGSGTMTDRLRELADTIDLSLLGILSAYEEITTIPMGEFLARPSFKKVELVTSIDLHACFWVDSGTGTSLHANIQQNGTWCSTGNLVDYQDVSRGEWHEYDGFSIGGCGRFSLDPSQPFQLKMNGSGTDAICLEHLQIKTNFAPAPKFTCHVPKDGVWLASDYIGSWNTERYTNAFKSECKAVNGISQLRIAVPNQAKAGSKGSIQLKFTFANGKGCTTKILDNKGRDLVRSSNNVYRADILDGCSMMALSDKDLIHGHSIEVQVINWSTDGLTIAGLEIHAILGEEVRKFRGRLDSAGLRVDGNTKNISCYEVHNTYEITSVYAVKIEAKNYISYLELQICSGEECCSTSAFHNIVKGNSELYKDVLLGQCDGFKILNNEYSILSAGKVNLVAVSIYNSVFKMISPMDTCYSDNFSNCQINTEFRVSSLKIGVCNVVHAGTDSQISVKICSKGECCSSLLDKPNENDFERGDWMEYFSYDLNPSCRHFPISTTDLKVNLRNEGPDALCIDRFQIRSDGLSPKILSCYLPLTNANWVENGFLEMKCA